MTTILFPARPSTREVDASFQSEFDAAVRAGFSTALVDEGEMAFSGQIRLIGLPKEPSLILYRGWLMRTHEYARLAELLRGRGFSLSTSPADYQRTYHLPEWYEIVSDTGLTPRSIWFPGAQFDVPEIAVQVAKAFGDSALVLKDYVKSRKHEWFEACFIPDASDIDSVCRVVWRFLELQDDFLVGGLVFREYWPTRRVGIHPKSRAPLANEHRTFVFHGKPFYSAPYWSVVEYDESRPPSDFIAPILEKTPSSFYAVDIAELERGGWFVVECNDGGSAGLPDPEDAVEFYRCLRECMSGKHGGS
ncbi:MAG TPA: ATP-grasp domain-containing protein [Polyangium sp.]|nr:ATP-grasp domain-containing protein [Polyangium sp.]